jgi:hypothetical protein
LIDFHAKFSVFFEKKNSAKVAVEDFWKWIKNYLKVGDFENFTKTDVLAMLVSGKLHAVILNS